MIKTEIKFAGLANNYGLGEEKLLCYYLQRMATDLLTGNRQERREAESFFFDENEDRIFNLSNVCGFLELPKNKIRSIILQIYQKKDSKIKRF